MLQPIMTFCLKIVLKKKLEKTVHKIDTLSIQLEKECFESVAKKLEIYA